MAAGMISPPPSEENFLGLTFDAIHEQIIRYFRVVLDEEVMVPPVLLSRTTNLVFRTLVRGGRRYVFKVLRKRKPNAAFLRHCHRALSSFVPIKGIIHIDDSGKYLNAGIQVSEYLNGVDVATLIEKGAMTRQREEALARFLDRLCQASACLELPVKGFGTYEPTMKMYGSFEESIEAFLAHYLGRFTALFGTGSEWYEIQRILGSFFRVNVNRRPYHFGVVPLDTNLKSIVFLEGSDQIALLHPPVLAYGAIPMGIGAVRAQIRNTTVEDAFMRLAGKRLPGLAEEAPRILFFETLILIGILSFYCKSGAEAVITASTWGYRSSFIERIRSNLKELAGH